MGENWFQREFLSPRRLIFNVLFYGVQFFLFGYGWHSQVCLGASFPRSCATLIPATGSEHEASCA